MARSRTMRTYTHLTLHTERLLLRPFAPTDAAAILALYAQPEVVRYSSTGPWQQLAQAEALIAHDQQAHAEGSALRLGIFSKGSQDLAGFCRLFDFHTQCRRAEIGYALAPAHWGKGYIQEALTALIAFGFGELGLNRIEADIDPRNEGSIRAAERLGFQREGLLREHWIVDGEVSDSYLYGLLRRDWQTTPPA